MDENIQSEDLSEFEEIKIKRLIKLSEDLEKLYNSLSDQFHNFTTSKKLDLVKDREEIISMDVFEDLFFTFMLYTTISDFVSQSGGETTDEQVEIIKIVDFVSSQGKINIRSLINNFISQYKKEMYVNDIYKENVRGVMKSFYDTAVVPAEKAN